ncbi:DNA-binding helix-turn-helix protein [Lactobacillus kullabergensis]|uniref:DNA-binding helix-turn-helix protein n=1 Tax=Lactobacillus kullabergensis TaxID=1218493 RepID=A0A0F4L862_9LACO|nr:helix-turn-helix transcriptional regulator [Lactobacillus kullabergensis]KJY54449.1 DNA-binding helix-turn-helix protein [Lactobacillus kullabergensis]
MKTETETEKMLDELTKDDPKLKEYAEQYSRQLDASVAVTKLRKKEGLSQQDLADKVNVSKSTIARIENGTMNPTLKMLDKIGMAVGKHLLISYN